jgi:rare lipoprotein A (peptidoglycan hydrolase)
MKLKTKTRKHIKRIKHTATRKKLLKKRTSQRLLRGLFAGLILISIGSLTVAIASTRPIKGVELEANVKPKSLSKEPVHTGVDQVGIASWYALGLPQPDALTCASTKFPRRTYLQVKNQRNGKMVVCRVNDYGPEAWTKRVIDLSRGSFRQIEDLSRGTAPVEIKVVPPPPTAFDANLPNDFGQFMGYSLCHQKHTKQFCEDHRQEQIDLR